MAVLQLFHNMKPFVIVPTLALALSSCSAGVLIPLRDAEPAQLATISTASASTFHFVVPFSAQTAIFDSCTNPASVVDGTEIGKLELNEANHAAGQIETFHETTVARFTSNDGAYSGRNVGTTTGVMNVADGFQVGNAHTTFMIRGAAGSLKVSETDHFIFGAKGKPSLTKSDFRVLCR